MGKYDDDTEYQHPNVCEYYFRFYFIYLLTAIGLSPGGSTHLHTNNT